MAKRGDTKHGPGLGKLIAAWPFVFDALVDNPNWKEPGDDESERTPPKQLAREARVEIQVYLSTNYRVAMEPPHPPEKVEFNLRVENEDKRLPEIRMSGTDIEALRKAMFSRLSDHFEIKWERYYLVEVTPGHIYGGLGEGMNYIYNDVEKGTCWDGSEVMRKWEYRNWKISPWPGEFKDEAGKVMACIPATDENSEALKEFAKRIASLRKAIAETLRPKNILQTLEWLRGNNKGILLLETESQAKGHT